MPGIDWMIYNWEGMKAKLWVHIGDIVNVPGDMTDTFLDKLDAQNIPYLVCIGNHDYDTIATRTATAFNTALPQARYTGRSWWSGGFYDAGSENAYLLMTIDSVDYIFLALEYGPRQAVVEWASALLTTYSARKAAIFTHGFLHNSGVRTTTGTPDNPHVYWEDSHDGEELWTELVKVHDNVIWVQSGHHIQAPPYFAHREDASDGGQTVIQNMCNFQTVAGGYMQFVTVDPVSEQLTFQTYSPPAGTTYADGKYSINY